MHERLSEAVIEVSKHKLEDVDSALEISLILLSGPPPAHLLGRSEHIVRDEIVDRGCYILQKLRIDVSHLDGSVVTLVFKAVRVPELRLGESHAYDVVNCVAIILTGDPKCFRVLTEIRDIVLNSVYHFHWVSQS